MFLDLRFLSFLLSLFTVISKSAMDSFKTANRARRLIGPHTDGDLQDYTFQGLHNTIPAMLLLGYIERLHELRGNFRERLVGVDDNLPFLLVSF